MFHKGTMRINSSLSELALGRLKMKTTFSRVDDVVHFRLSLVDTEYPFFG